MSCNLAHDKALLWSTLPTNEAHLFKLLFGPLGPSNQSYFESLFAHLS